MLFPESLGLYFWGGFDVPNALVPGLIRLQQAGFLSTTRIRLTPAVKPSFGDEYRFDSMWEAEVALGPSFLPAAVKSTQYQEAFNLPGLKTIVLQTYDSATYDPFEANRFLDLGWLQSNEELVRSEYRDMTIALYENLDGSNKRFIISNWETDNNIYGDKLIEPPQVSAPRIRALIKWFQLRQEGIREGREAANIKKGGVEVNDAIEFKYIYYAKEYKSCGDEYVGDTLHNIIKYVKPDYASYSAWESTERGRLYDDLLTAKQILHLETNGHTQLIVGELGVTEHFLSSSPSQDPSVKSKIWRYVQFVHEAIRAEIPVIILWKAWDRFPDPSNPNPEGEGLFNGDGSERKIYWRLWESFSIPATPRITGVADKFDLYGWVDQDQKRHFEIYGRFSGCTLGGTSQSGWVGSYRAIAVFSDGEAIALDTEGEKLSQINIAVKPHPSKIRWFVVRAWRKGDGASSNEFGPVRLKHVWEPTSDCHRKVNRRFWIQHNQ